MQKNKKNEAGSEQKQMDALTSARITEMTAEIVSSYASANRLSVGELKETINTVFESLDKLSRGSPVPVAVENKRPAVPIKKSIEDDYLICLEDGKKFKSLKRHLESHYGMTPEQYRVKWGLPSDYPMVAPNYARQRSRLAKQFGLGRKPAKGAKTGAAA